jgi:hypothetical protein
VGDNPHAIRLDQPAVVLVHGFNPYPRLMHFDLARAVQSCRGNLCGPQIFAWDWNAATRPSLRPSVNTRNAEAQGVCLAAAMHDAGMRPQQTHLVAHSLGCVVAASAARYWANETGEQLAQFTLLEPLAGHHTLIFEDYAVTSTADYVENRWSAGLTGFGQPAATLGVHDLRVRNPAPHWTRVCPTRLNHVYVLRSYLRELRDE